MAVLFVGPGKVQPLPAQLQERLVSHLTSSSSKPTARRSNSSQIGLEAVRQATSRSVERLGKVGASLALALPLPSALATAVLSRDVPLEGTTAVASPIKKVSCCLQ